MKHLVRIYLCAGLSGCAGAEFSASSPDGGAVDGGSVDAGDAYIRPDHAAEASTVDGGPVDAGDAYIRPEAAPVACDLGPCIDTPAMAQNCHGVFYALCCDSPDLNHPKIACEPGATCGCGICPTADYDADAGQCRINR